MDEVKVGGAALANISLAGAQAWITECEPLLRMILLLLQIGVAGITIVYVATKIKVLWRSFRNKIKDSKGK